MLNALFRKNILFVLCDYIFGVIEFICSLVTFWESSGRIKLKLLLQLKKTLTKKIGGSEI